MTRGETHTFLILDASVVIDYENADLSVLATISKHVAPVAVARPVLDEVGLDEADAVELGITIVDVDLALASEAAKGPRVLSFEDRVCLLVAQRESWTCVTNDKPLRNACIAESVSVMWGLELMLEAVGIGALSPAEAIAIAEAIHESNPRFVTEALLSEFKRKVRQKRS